MRTKQHNFPLRFRTKKQKAQAETIAKIKGWSLNEYLLRILESQPEMQPVQIPPEFTQQSKAAD